MSNARKPKHPVPLNGTKPSVEDLIARSTHPLMEDQPQPKEKQVNAPRPVGVVSDNNPDTPEDTVVTARFNRRKIAKIAGTATAVVGGLALFGAAMKQRGKAEFLDDVRYANGDDTDENAAS